jgi:hypothetical protein
VISWFQSLLSEWVNLYRYATDGGDPNMLKLVDAFEYNFGLLYADNRAEWVNWWVPCTR